MLKSSLSAVAFTIAAMSVIGATAVMSADAPSVTRKVLNQQDVMSGNTMAEIAVEIPVGGREGRHTHPGPLMVYVTEGAISLDYEGKENITYKAGEAFFVEAGKIHEGINRGNVPARAIATFVGPKGPPITTQVQ